MKASIKIILKKTKLSNGTYPINLRITINRKSKFYKTPYNTLPKFWNEKTSEFNSKHKNYLQSNRVLELIKQQASKTMENIIERGDKLTLETFDSHFRPKENPESLFISYFIKRKNQFHNAGKISSRDSYNDTISALLRFNHKIKNYPFTKINYALLLDFETYLRANNCQDGGIGVYMRNIRAVYNEAIKSKITSRDTYPFKDYKISKLKSTKIKKALSKNDFQLLLDYKFSTNREGTKALYAYLLSFYCRGMNFTDLAELKWNDIDLDNFNYTRNKTKVNLSVKIPHNEYTIKILNYFKSYRPYDTDYILPILKKDISLYSNEELKMRKKSVLNRYGKLLKIISQDCGIKTRVNFYTARHTFATLSLKKGVNTVMIKQALGHKSIKTTEAYLEDFHTEELNTAFENLI